MTNDRRRLPSIVGALSLVLMTGLGCEPDHNPNKPGPPKIVAAYVVPADLPAACDTSDLRSWGGPAPAHTFYMRDSMGMQQPIRCVPNLILDDSPGPFHYNSVIWLIFSELLDGDKIEVQDNVLLTS